MKKLLLICTILITTVAYAQKKNDIKISIFSGVNIATPIGDDMEDYIEDYDDFLDLYQDTYSNITDADGEVMGRTGMHIGFDLDYFIKDNLAFNSGITYSQKGFKQDYDVKGYDSNTLVSFRDKLNVVVKLDYLDIPLGIKFTNFNGFEVKAGILFCMLVNDKGDIDLDGDNYTLDEDVIKDIDNFEDAFDEEPNSVLTGYQIGVGYTFNQRLFIGAKMQQTSSFGEMNDVITGSYNDYEENKNLTYQVSIGVYL